MKQNTDAAYFNILVERRHADRLEKKDIDEESKLEVTYRILKDQLRRAKQELLKIKMGKEVRKKEAIEIK